MRMTIGIAVVAMTMAGLSAARADELPGLRGHDHTGITVPDMDQAVSFFTDVLGCKAAMTFGPFSGMGEVLNINSQAVVEKITMVRCGAGSNIELFKYSSPDQKDMTPKNSDIGGMHIALYVDDVQKAKDYLDRKGVKTFKGPIPVGQGPAAGETILYFVAPWGLQFEAISYPKGLGYEKGASTVLWKPTEPGK
ncbi:VOC family protein [Lichenifustis flavocetrariae]|uniref:VOC family protein n=1 Tax=Lichenifustis flavocetrariae TaxID=2949735 RepID=A0AA41YZB3_9HYPH|nr:VOC family protein [Lichenifustis flavocetrariae]MCW6509997.1 VOC family protein [Lichenifustis flavocetrariae]